jgi:hypothetical protein
VWLRNDGVTIEWNGTAWTQRQVSGPSPRYGTRLVWDGVNQKVLAFGGSTSNGQLLQETWQYDGTTWSQPPVGARPSARTNTALCWDSARHRVVLFGGYSIAGALDDTWEWNGTTWLQFFPATRPYPRQGHVLSFDSLRNRTVLSGSASSSTADLWEWNGTVWTQQSVPANYSNRSNQGQCFDPTLGVTLIWSGAFGSGPRDMWAWNGTSLALVPGSAAPNTLAAAATDLTHGQIVGFESGPWPFGAWLWNGSWSFVTRAQAPTARSGTAMAFDPGRARCTLFGGVGSGVTNDTWEWDGYSWLNRTPVHSPSMRSGHAMAMLGGHGTVLFGGIGNGYLYDTWSWDGADWHDITPIAGPVPPPRTGHGLAAIGNHLLLFGGTDSANLFNDTWTFDGTWWTPVLTATSPPARSRHIMGADGSGTTAYMAGGVVATSPDLVALDDSWSFNGTDWVAGPPLPQPVYDGFLVLQPGSNLPEIINGPQQNRVETFVLTSTPADAIAFGQGCAGSNGVPQLSAAGRPRVGNSGFSVHIGIVPAQALTAFLLGLYPASIPLPGGCTQLLQNPLTLGLAAANAAGYAVTPLPIPNSAALAGVVILAQGACIDPAGAYQNIASLTGGLRLALGQ